MESQAALVLVGKAKSGTNGIEGESMNTAWKYFSSSVQILYDKIVPNGVVIGKDGHVKRPGLHLFLLICVVVIILTSIFPTPFDDFLASLLCALFFIVCGMSLVRYVRDGVGKNNTSSAYPYRISKKGARRLEMPQEIQVSLCSCDEEKREDATDTKGKTNLGRKGKPIKEYSSHSSVVAINEALYGLPFDPDHEVSYK